ncbi:hypothetical protein D3C85_1384380 [compost metagenome]
MKFPALKVEDIFILGSYKLNASAEAPGTDFSREVRVLRATPKSLKVDTAAFPLANSAFLRMRVSLARIIS